MAFTLIDSSGPIINALRSLASLASRKLARSKLRRSTRSGAAAKLARYLFSMTFAAGSETAIGATSHF
jgi:hypothetical protein